MVRRKPRRKPLGTIWEISDELWRRIEPILLEFWPKKPTGRKVANFRLGVPPWGQTEFQVNLKLGLTPHADRPTPDPTRLTPHACGPHTPVDPTRLWTPHACDPTRLDPTRLHARRSGTPARSHNSARLVRVSCLECVFRVHASVVSPV